MRFVPFAAVSATALVLAACGETTESLTMQQGLQVCGLSCPYEQAKPEPAGPLPTTPPTANSGNSTKISSDSGDTTIALEQSIIINDKNKLARSKLTLAGSGNDRTAVLAIDTKTSRNSMWPKPKTMNFYEFGTNLSPDTLGGNYVEYRELTASQEEGTNIDEELQVWTWGNSYATQYRDVTSGGPDADHQAWSFGGTRTKAAAMPTGGTATLSGQFGGTAKTEGWLNTKDPRQTLDYNNLWRVKGKSNVVADFGNNRVNAVLSPEKWQARETMNGGTDYKTIVVDRSNYPGKLFLQQTEPNIKVDYFYQDIILQGTITKDLVKGNTVSGRTLFGPARGYLSNSTKNPFEGAFFGPAANEFTGIFNVEATTPVPIGGDFPINGDERATVQISGTVHAE